MLFRSRMSVSAEVAEDGWVWRHLTDACRNDEKREFSVEVRSVLVCSKVEGGRGSLIKLAMVGGRSRECKGTETRGIGFCGGADVLVFPR